MYMEIRYWQSTRGEVPVIEYFERLAARGEGSAAASFEFLVDLLIATGPPLGMPRDRVIDRAPAGDDELIECLVGRSAPAELGMIDFPEVLQHAELLQRLLSGAVAGKAKGVNVLLYGPPGTGKTELAKTLAKAAGARLFAVGETDE